MYEVGVVEVWGSSFEHDRGWGVARTLNLVPGLFARGHGPRGRPELWI